MTDPIYDVLLEKDTLVFSAAHFITFNGNVCERLHGHNYRVRCRVSGALDENGYVIDFIALRDALTEIVGRLDHHMLLPQHHATIKVTESDGEVTARFEERRWVFPTEDCVILPIANTTAELMAGWIGSELITALRQKMPDAALATVTISVDENRGQWASVRLPW